MLLLLFFISDDEESKISSINSLLNFGIFSFVCCFIYEHFHVLIGLCFSPYQYTTDFEQYFCANWSKFGLSTLILINDVKFFCSQSAFPVGFNNFHKVKNLSTLAFEKGIQKHNLINSKISAKELSFFFTS